MTNHEQQKEERRYADEETRIGYETLEKALKVASLLPPEGLVLNVKPIEFEEEHELRGLTVAFGIGLVLPTGKRRVLQVPERTRKVLDILEIPYRIASEDL